MKSLDTQKSNKKKHLLEFPTHQPTLTHKLNEFLHINIRTSTKLDA